MNSFQWGSRVHHRFFVLFSFIDLFLLVNLFRASIWKTFRGSSFFVSMEIDFHLHDSAAFPFPTRIFSATIEQKCNYGLKLFLLPIRCSRSSHLTQLSFTIEKLLSHNFLLPLPPAVHFTLPTIAEKNR
jgi:hypothetical protein